jgi:hypothetical protein
MILPTSNSRIYKVTTRQHQRAPLRGFHFVHIPGPIAEQKSEKKGRKKYDRKSEINKDEIHSAASRLFQSKKEGIESIMVLTPVSFPNQCTHYGVATLKSIRKISVSLNVLFTYFSTRSSSVSYNSVPKEELRRCSCLDDRPVSREGSGHCCN